MLVLINMYTTLVCKLKVKKRMGDRYRERAIMNLTISVGRLRLCGLIRSIQNTVLIVAFFNKTTNRKV
jgi:hypothetical protein